MSHLTKSDFKAAKMRCEEAVKKALKQIDSFGFRKDVRDKIIKDFGLDKAPGQIEKTEFKSSYSGLAALNAIAEKANSYLSSVETYVAYNFDLNVKDFKEAVREASELLVTSGDDVVGAALASTEDALLQTYIRSTAMSEKFSDAGELVKAADAKMKKSMTYRNIASQNAKKIFEAKNITVEGADGLSAAEIISKTNRKTNDEAVDKAVRDRVLTAVVKIIKEQGFIVKKENVEECGDHAKISAIKPNGEQAEFAVHMDGKFIYKFHNYEGLSCEKDIGNFEDKFESVYGVKLENKNIMWSNPDRLGKTAVRYAGTKETGG